MRTTLPLLLSFTFLITTLVSNAQTDHFAYAVTDLTKDGFGWNALRKLDLQTGQYSEVIFNGTDQKVIAFDALTKKGITPQPDAKYGTALQAPFSTGVAAMAYDKRHNRLYYTPMFIDQLRYIDLSTMKVYCVTTQAFTGYGNLHNDEGKVITRMVIAPDGYGYAISNDGNAFIKFSTAKKTTITQLGSLANNPSNGDMSIHARQTSWGGDMIADDKGNLIVITAPANVFVVNTENRVATFTGHIQSLPDNFTANGAVVNTDGSLLISSAIDNNAYYQVDMASLTAKPYSMPSGVYRSSDLANSNYLSTNKNGTEINTVARPITALTNAIFIYPNPVTTAQFKVQFKEVNKGDYTVELSNVTGQKILQQKIAVLSKNQTQPISISVSNAKGIYFVKVFDINHTSVYEQKVMVQ